MADKKTVQLRRGTTAEHERFLGADGEVTVDTDKHTAVVHDGKKLGGYPLRIDATEIVRNRYLTFRAALVQQGIPSLGFSVGDNGPSPIAILEPSGIITGAAVFLQNKLQTVQDHFMLPVDWVPPLTLDILWRTEGVLGSVTWNIQTCNVPIGSTIEQAVFGPQHEVTTQAGTGLPYTLMTSTITLDTTAFAPQEELFFRLMRTFDTAIGGVQLLSLRFNVKVSGR